MSLQTNHCPFGLKNTQLTAYSSLEWSTKTLGRRFMAYARKLDRPLFWHGASERSSRQWAETYKTVVWNCKVMEWMIFDRRIGDRIWIRRLIAGSFSKEKIPQLGLSQWLEFWDFENFRISDNLSYFGPSKKSHKLLENLCNAPLQGNPSHSKARKMHFWAP